VTNKSDDREALSLPRAREVLEEARRMQSDATFVLDAPDQRRRAAREAFEKAREAVVQRQLAALPIGRLRETTMGGVRLGALERAGITTVAQAAAASPSRLQSVPGVGPHTATQVVAAARQLKTAMTESLQFRFDVQERPPEQAGLLQALRACETAESTVAPLRPDLEQLTSALDDLLKRGSRASSRFKMFFTRGGRRTEVMSAVTKLEVLSQSKDVKSLDKRTRYAAQAIQQRPSSDP